MDINIDTAFSDKTTSIKSEKILCIVEGKDELNILKRMYEVSTSNVIDCEEFNKNIIKLFYAKSEIFWNDITNCNFQGGRLDGCSVPITVLEALNKEDLDLYQAIIVMFDNDCDEDQLVESTSRALLNSFKSIIVSSSPCFEKHLISFIKEPTTTDTYISDNYSIINGSKCKWFKSNFSKVPRIMRFKKILLTDKLIPLLHKNDFENVQLDTELRNLYIFSKSVFQ